MKEKIMFEQIDKDGEIINSLVLDKISHQFVCGSLFIMDYMDFNYGRYGFNIPKGGRIEISAI